MVRRRVGLRGACNFRDLGGVTTVDGRTVAYGRVFRSDALHRLDEDDVATFERLAIARVFDLRSRAELASDGVAAFLGSRHEHLPLIEITLSPFDPSIDWGSIDLQERYVEMLTTGGAAIRRIVEAVAAHDARPIVFHCTGGKDRTGVVAAVLLRALGVRDQDIVEDYAVSQSYLRDLLEPYRSELTTRGLGADAIAYLTSSPPKRIEYMLAQLDRKWGSAADYLRWIGVDDETVSGLRANLLR